MTRFFLRFLLRHSGWILLVATLASIPCVFYSAELYGNLKPDLEELLPRQARSIQDLDEIRSRLQSVDNLAVLIFSSNVQASKRFVEDLAQKLEKEPPDTVASVEYRIDRELKFFSDRKALFVDLNDLNRILQFIRDRIDYEKQLYNPLNIFSGVELKEPRLDFKGMISRYEGQASSFSRFPGGYYATPDEQKRVILIYLPATSGGIHGVYHLKEVVAHDVETLIPASYSPDLKVLYTGGVQNTIEEHHALIEDLAKSAEIVTILVTLALIVFFRSLVATFALFFSLFMARFWTFTATWFTIGYLNANSAFMGSIVLGSGITFGVMLLSRYLEERRLGRVPIRAAHIAIRRTIRATLTASLAAGLAYGSLFLTQFQGFRQYGVIGLMGMIFCWLSSIVVFPSLLLTIERYYRLVKPQAKPRRAWIFGPLTTALGLMPGLILSMSVGLTIFSIIEIMHFDPRTIIETNLAHLRNKESMAHGSGFLSKYVDEIFQAYLSPVVLLARSESEASKIADTLAEQKRREGKDSLIASVRSLKDFVPANQAQKIVLFHQIEETLPPKIKRRLSPSEQAQLADFLTPAAKRGFSQSDLPELVLKKFTEKDHSVGKLVLVEPPLSSDRWSGAELNRFVNGLRATADQISPKSPGTRPIPVAGGLPITSDMLEAISRDGPKATLFAFLGVVALILLLFRKPKIAFLMLSALLLGNLWLFGFILWAGIKINFLNFIALPITFGIGVDYGVNVFHRYLHDPSRDILKVVRETGAAVGLCSLTTIIGYSSLLIAGNQAFVSFGLLAVVGEVTSVLAAILSVPALLLVLQRVRLSRGESRDPMAATQNSSP